MKLPQLMPPQDSMFIIPETREQPMHVGSLQVFDLPEGADQHYVGELYREAINAPYVAPLFCKRPKRSVTTLGQWAWVEDVDLDLEHHVRHSALPQPGRVRELLALVSRLHGTLLDRKRPLWEAHLIEGLEGNRFAVYTKMHHALMDGVSGLRLMQRSMSTDPSDQVPMPYARRPRSRQRSAPGLVETLFDLPASTVKTAVDVAGTLPAAMQLAYKGLIEQSAALPMTAPHTMFNVSITGSRRFAADAWPLDRIRAVGKAAGATVNDVVLAMCSGALRAYMLELDALPASPLVAMTPVSLRSADDDSDEPSNATGVILCNLGTHLDDAEQRLQTVRASMNASKEVLRGRSQLQVTALSALAMSPLALNTFVALHKFAPPPFNLVISNVPGPNETLYFNGARLEGLYPLSIPTHGQALNITVTSYDGCLQFGLTGCRRSVPRLQRLLTHLEDSLAELEKAYV